MIVMIIMKLWYRHDVAMPLCKRSHTGALMLPANTMQDSRDTSQPGLHLVIPVIAAGAQGLTYRGE